MRIVAPHLQKKQSRALSIVITTAMVAVIVGMLITTAMAQTTYVITDGDQVTVHTTYASDPARVLQEAGVTLDAEDQYTTQRSGDVSEITVKRAQTIHLDNCGQEMQLTNYGGTLGELLDELSIPAQGDYIPSVSLSTLTYDGMRVSIQNKVIRQETYTLAVPFETTTCEDDTLPKGQQRVLVQGKVGQTVRTDSVRYVNTQEESRVMVSETVIEQPKDCIIAIGTGKNVGAKQDQPLIGNGVIVLPSGEVLTYTSKDKYCATAYTKTDPGCDEYTATGSHVHIGTVAVDPTVIPYGTRMFIVSNDGKYIYGVSTAEDCGGAIQGKRLDLYMDTEPDCLNFGVRDCTVYFLGDANWR